MVNPPYVAQEKPTGMIFIALDKQNIQAIMETIQKIVGPKLVKPFVDFKNPLEVIPRTIANRRNI